MSYPYRFYAVVIPGLEPLAARELASLSAHEIEPDEGGVHFSGTLETLYRVNLRARLVTRVLLRLDSFRAMSWPELFNKSRKLTWKNLIPPEAVVHVQASCHRSRLMHSGRAAAVVGDAMVDRIGCRLAASAAEADQHVRLRFDRDICTISLDSSGERLDRRGYRLQSGAAPVRETLAAGLLAWVDWQPEEPLLVPMCGSGTFAIEAVLQARHIAPGLPHAFPLTAWPICKEKAWKRAMKKAGGMAGHEGALRILASDIASEAMTATRENAIRAGVADDLEITTQDMFALEAPESQGVMLCNPPFGIRIGRDAAMFYHRLGEHLRRSFGGWRVAVICPDRTSEKALGIEADEILRIRHGGRWMNVLQLKP